MSVASRTLPALAALALSLALALPARAATVAGVALPDTARLAGETLPLRGAGVRKKLFIKLYVASLYAAESGDPLADDAPAMVRLNILSKLLTRERMVEALEEGFEKSTGGNTAPIQDGVDAMLAALPDEVTAGERYDLVYLPDSGTTLARDGETLATVEGIAFKRALFGIWLSGDPVQADLKKDMLGD